MAAGQFGGDDVAGSGVNQTSAPWGVFVGFGLLMMLAGVAAIAFPIAATFAAEIVIGAILVFSGACQLIQAISRARWKGRALTGLTGALAVAAGVLLLVFPLSGVLTLTIVMAAYFLVSGAFRLALAFQLRPEDSWGWMALSGAMALLLGILVLFQLPEISAWLIGLLLGIDLLFAGTWALFLGFAQRRSTAAAA